MTETDFLRLIATSFPQPRVAARELNALRFNRGILWSFFLLIVCISTLVMVTSMSLVPLPPDYPLTGMKPLSLAIVLGGILIVTIFAFYFIGQMMGGTGRFPGALLLVTWLQLLGAVVTGVQILTFLILPALLPIVSFVGTIYLGIALVIFIDELHGFGSIFKAIGTVIVAILGAVFGLTLIVTLIGVTAMGANL